jgi:hypothetical protein
MPTESVRRQPEAPSEFLCGEGLLLPESDEQVASQTFESGEGVHREEISRLPAFVNESVEENGSTT